MANLTDSLKKIIKIPGNLGSALVDIETGLCIAKIGGRTLDLTTDAEDYARYMRVKEKVVNDISLEGPIEEIVFTSSLYYHLLYPVKIRILKVKEPENLFFLLVLSKSGSNLALVRSRVKQIVDEFTI